MGRRYFGRIRAFAALAWAMARVPLWLWRQPGSPDARRHERRFFAAIVRGFGIRISVSGDRLSSPGTLYVMNHISWADIAVMMAILDADFVAKDTVAGWPVLGPLARRFDPLFVNRDQALRSSDQARAIRERLARGRSVILCPEGTTSDGTGILPFRSSLFAAADAACAVQPVMLRYLCPDGAPLDPARLREVAWIDDDALLPGAARVARMETLASVTFLAPLRTADRKALAQAAWTSIATAYAALPNRSR